MPMIAMTTTSGIETASTTPQPIPWANDGRSFRSNAHATMPASSPTRPTVPDRSLEIAAVPEISRYRITTYAIATAATTPRLVRDPGVPRSAGPRSCASDRAALISAGVYAASSAFRASASSVNRPWFDRK